MCVWLVVTVSDKKLIKKSDADGLLIIVGKQALDLLRVGCCIYITVRVKKTAVILMAKFMFGNPTHHGLFILAKEEKKFV